MGKTRLTNKSYIIKRLAITIPQFFFVMVITFSLLHIAPGNPVEMFFGGPEGDEQLVAELVKEYGFDKPILNQFVIWSRKLLHGDLGISYVTGRQVSLMIKEKLYNTLTLMLTSIIFAIIIGISFGIICAYKQYSSVDNFMRAFVIIGRAAPSFWIGLMSMLLFGVYLGWFPVSGTITLGLKYENVFEFIKDKLWHMFMPVSILSYQFLATYTRMTRSSMLNVLNQDYIRTARSKGLSEKIVLLKHSLKNALLPVITIIGMNMGRLINGSVIIETIFGWPGLGTLAIQSVLRRDYSVIMALVLMTGILIVLANLITDLSYAYIDPRVKY
jgi:peptide/nickel transport system permease protein